MSEIKIVEEVDYTGKFKVGDGVRVVGLVSERYLLSDTVGKEYVIGRINERDKTLPYYLYGDDVTGYWFNEAELELVEGSDEIKRNDDSLDTLWYSIERMNRPASSHYHTKNNGNDVWQFADDNLSDERVKGFHQINAIKYISRYEKKHDTAEKRIEDLEKAKVSIDKLIELEGLE